MGAAGGTERQFQIARPTSERARRVALDGGKSAGANTGSVAVRFRNPDNASQQWTGRGRQPKWVKEWVEGGKSLDKLRV